MKLIFTFLFGLITVFSCTTQIKKENEQTTLPHLTELKKEKQQNSRSYLDNGDFQKGTYPKSKYWGSYELHFVPKMRLTNWDLAFSLRHIVSTLETVLESVDFLTLL